MTESLVGWEFSKMANPGKHPQLSTPDSGGGSGIQPLGIQSVDDLIIQPVDEREEKTIYSAFYDRIYPMIRNRSLNFADISEKTALPRRRLEESLLHRLGSGQVRQLYGHNPGNCYVCKNALYSKKSSEPICLRCLQQVDSYITMVTGKKSSYEINKEMVVPSPKLEIELGSGEPITETDIEMLAPESNPSLFDLPEKNAEDILAILAYEEDDLLETDFSLHEIDNMMQQLHTGPLRHYGFKRVKKANTTNSASQA